jgi:hypothetical protein
MDFNGMAAKRHKTLKSSSVYVPLAPSCGYSPLRICEVLRDFLDDIIEDQLELDSGFKEKIERAKKEIADGVYSRVRQPQPEK